MAVTSSVHVKISSPVCAIPRTFPGRLAKVLGVNESTVRKWACFYSRNRQADGSIGLYYSCRSVSGKGVIVHWCQAGVLR